MASKKETEQNIVLLETTLLRMTNNLTYPNRELLINTYKRLIKEVKAELKPSKAK